MEQSRIEVHSDMLSNATAAFTDARVCRSALSITLASALSGCDPHVETVQHQLDMHIDACATKASRQFPGHLDIHRASTCSDRSRAP